MTPIKEKMENRIDDIDKLNQRIDANIIELRRCLLELKEEKEDKLLSRVWIVTSLNHYDLNSYITVFKTEEGAKKFMETMKGRAATCGGQIVSCGCVSYPLEE